MPATIKLSKPLVTHNGEVNEVTLRDITARDMVEMRVSPVNVSMKGEGVGNARVTSNSLEIRYDIAMGYLTRLSGIDEIILGTLPARDFDACIAELNKMWNDAGE